MRIRSSRASSMALLRRAVRRGDRTGPRGLGPHGEAALAGGAGFLFRELGSAGEAGMTSADRFREARDVFSDLVDLPDAERRLRLDALDRRIPLSPPRSAVSSSRTRRRTVFSRSRRRSVSAPSAGRRAGTSRTASPRLPSASASAPTGCSAGSGAAAWAKSFSPSAPTGSSTSASRSSSSGAGMASDEILARFSRGAPDPRAARASAHRAPARRRRDGGRAAVLRHGARRGRADHRVLPRARPPRRGPPPPARRLLRRRGGGAPQPRRPPRPEALNVLVTKGGEVKLLDFGIAKLLGTRTPARRPPRRARSCASSRPPTRRPSRSSASP